jgi:hypothetical protein
MHAILQRLERNEDRMDENLGNEEKFGMNYRP